MQKNPDLHLAQHKLAEEATELVHGCKYLIPLYFTLINPTINSPSHIPPPQPAAGLRHARIATDVLFGRSLHDVSGRDLVAAFKDDASRLVRLSKDDVIGQGVDALAARVGATKSKSRCLFGSAERSASFVERYMLFAL